MIDFKYISIIMVFFMALFTMTPANLLAASKKLSPEAKEIKSRLKNLEKDLIDFYKTGSNKAFAIARVKLERILVKYPDNVTVNTMLGMIYSKKSQDIADSLAKRTDIKARQFFQIGNLFLAQKRFEKSVECYNKVTDAFPKWSCPHRHKGEALMKMNRDEEAIASLEKSIEVRKNHFDAYVYLARAQVKVNRYNEAKETLAMAIKVAKENGICKDEAGEPEADMVDVYELYAKIYKAIGDSVNYQKYKEILKKLDQ